MGSLYIVGGQQKYLRPFLADDSNWYEYHKGVILRLSPEDARSETIVEYTSPPEARAENGVATLFKSSTIKDDTLYACTQTEILIYRLPDFQKLHYVSLPCFNDVHHVTPTPDGNVAVAVAGLDMVLVMTPEGKVLAEYNLLGEDPWKNFSREIDYRQLSTKPHKAHPNFIFFVDEEMWATRFYQKDAVSVKNPARRIEIGTGTPHDGLVHGDYIFFTTVNGNVIVANKKTLAIEERIDLNALHDYGAPLGWCRSVYVNGDKLWIGFSRIRPTKLRENVEWVKRSLKSKITPVLPDKIRTRSRWLNSRLKRELPTHIACYDLTRKSCLTEVNMEPHGISAIFGIFDAPPIPAVSESVPLQIAVAR